MVILWEMPFWKVFLIIYLFDYLSFIEKQWEYEKCKWKIGDRKVCVSNLNFAVFKKEQKGKEQKGKEQKERDKSRNPAGAIYCIPTEQNSFSVVIHT